MKCKHHCCSNTVHQHNTNRFRQFCSKACRNRYMVGRRRMELKFKALQHKGGKCELCGFTGSVACFDFHHLDPSQKLFALSMDAHTRSWERIKAEIDKCQLLCANCHREVEFQKTAENKLYYIELKKKYNY